MSGDAAQIPACASMRDSIRVTSAITRVLVVDDHGIVREGLYALLEKHRNLRVVGSAATGEEAIVAGASSADIAHNLSLSRKTVDTYRGRLMVKLGVSNRSALIRLAIENELTSL
jgi:DNA-binding NarL/FixJ family response regulator